MLRNHKYNTAERKKHPKVWELVVEAGDKTSNVTSYVG